ncbi:unnamed protein product, partial [Allacma fusca]
MRPPFLSGIGIVRKYLLYNRNTRNAVSRLQSVYRVPYQCVHTDFSNSGQNEDTNGGKGTLWIFAAVGSVALGLALGTGLDRSTVTAASQLSKKGKSDEVANLPTFTKDEVAKHHNLESG